MKYLKIVLNRKLKHLFGSIKGFSHFLVWIVSIFVFGWIGLLANQFYYTETSFVKNLVLTLQFGGFKLYTFSYMGAVLLYNVCNLINDDFEEEPLKVLAILEVIFVIILIFLVFIIKQPVNSSTDTLDTISSKNISFNEILTLGVLCLTLVMNFVDFLLALNTDRLDDYLKKESSAIEKLKSRG